MNFRNQRSGFTLVEILIVLGIIVAVAAIFVPVALNLTDRNQVAKGASMLENALSIAKSRAIAERRPNGIRLIAANNGLRTTAGGAAFAWYDEIQYIEDPSDYAEHWVWGAADLGLVSVTQPWWSLRRGGTTFGPAAPIPGALPWAFDTVTLDINPITIPTAIIDPQGTTQNNRIVQRNFLLFSPITGSDWRGTPPFPKPFFNYDNGTNDAVTGTDTYRSQRLQYSFAGNTPATVQVGDRIEITGTGQLYTVVSLSTGVVQVSAANNANVCVIEIDRPLSSNVVPALNGRPNYRIVRQPRPISSIPPMKLPQDVVIDFTIDRSSFPGATNLDTNNSIFMSNVSSGANVTGITGITTTTPNFIAPHYIDVMFAPSGEVMPTSQVFRNGTAVGSFSIGSSGLIALWLHQRGDPNLWVARQATAAQGNADNQAIVAINARTGFIGSYPMTPLSVSTDPLFYARLGKARISADTGQ